MTWHHITWHDISQLITLPRLTSPHNQPHYFISPRNQPHQNRSPHHHHGPAEGSFTQKTRFGHRTGWSPCAHSIGKFFLWLLVLFPFETSAPACPALLALVVVVTVAVVLAQRMRVPRARRMDKAYQTRPSSLESIDQHNCTTVRKFQEHQHTLQIASIAQHSPCLPVQKHLLRCILHVCRLNERLTPRSIFREAPLRLQVQALSNCVGASIPVICPSHS